MNIVTLLENPKITSYMWDAWLIKDIINDKNFQCWLKILFTFWNHKFKLFKLHFDILLLRMFKSLLILNCFRNLCTLHKRYLRLYFFLDQRLVKISTFELLLNLFYFLWQIFLHLHFFTTLLTLCLLISKFRFYSLRYVT